tara:strand:+ start:105595 stop:106248 length:654 start_codon:yes stop_codon:yes gene_type:complete
MLVIGITGSIGMGKSTIAGVFKEYGAAVWDADRAAHSFLEPGGLAVSQIAKLFPKACKTNSKDQLFIDRTELGKEVLKKNGNLKAIEKILHPLIHQQEKKFLLSAKLQRYSIVVLDIPLLFESNRTDRFDAILVVSAPEFVQRLRVLSRPGMTNEKYEAILNHQMSDEEKRRKADFVLETGLNKAFSRKSLLRIIKTLEKRPCRKWSGYWSVNLNRK